MSYEYRSPIKSGLRRYLVQEKVGLPGLLLQLQKEFRALLERWGIVGVQILKRVGCLPSVVDIELLWLATDLLRNLRPTDRKDINTSSPWRSTITQCVGSPLWKLDIKVVFIHYIGTIVDPQDDTRWKSVSRLRTSIRRIKAWDCSLHKMW